jgi:hypothetical protein
MPLASCGPSCPGTRSVRSRRQVCARHGYQCFRYARRENRPPAGRFRRRLHRITFVERIARLRQGQRGAPLEHQSVGVLREQLGVDPGGAVDLVGGEIEPA